MNKERNWTIVAVICACLAIACIYVAAGMAAKHVSDPLILSVLIGGVISGALMVVCARRAERT